MSDFLDWAELAADVDGILSEFRSVTLRAVTTGDYDPATGSVPTSTVDCPASAATFDFGLHLSGTAFLPGTMIQGGDKQIFMSASVEVPPAPGMLVIAGSDTWSVVGVKSISPAGTPVMYELLGRK